MKKAWKGNFELKPLLVLVVLYLFWIVIFAVQKPVFMLVNRIDGATVGDFFNVIVHGVKLDFCLTAYILFIPLLILLINEFIRRNVGKVLYICNVIFLVIVTIVFSVDAILYSYWGFRMDATLIFYLKDFNESLNSVTFKDVLKFLLIAVPYFLFGLFLYRVTVAKLFKTESKTSVSDYKLSQRIINSVVLVLCIPVLIVCTRGGVSTATANIGMVYYCDNQKLNLAAVNPAFSLMYSLSKAEDFSKKYQFYEENVRKREFDKLFLRDTVADAQYDVINESFLTTERPNVLVIILESFTARVVGAVNGDLAVTDGKEVTPNLNRIAEQSLVFDAAYSNGMRTDRGVVSILTGFPAQPDMSIIKYPEKTRNLPSMAKTLSKAGYKTQMLYGGDIDFANMRSYFYSSMYNDVRDYKSFDAKDRLSKWGVNDEKTFAYLYDMLAENYTNRTPFLTTFLTLSSHEPFDVNMQKFSHPYVNSVAYTDSCLGVFLSKLKRTDLWRNTLVILVADHATVHPTGLDREDTRLYRIPMIFTGGVIKQPRHVERLVNQTDIPKTVFTAMNLPCEDFIYSRDVLDKNVPNWAFFVYTNGLGFIDDKGATVWDNDASKIVYGADKQREMKGKVLLQTIYKHIGQL